MKNTFGQSLTVTLFGESHGPAVGALIDGIAPGIEVSDEEIKRQLSRRRPSDNLATARREPDNYQILSGVFEGRTTGTPICISIPNTDTRSGDYERGKARPSHADYAAYCKYHGFEDYRGGGHFSGRITAALTAVGGILLPALRKCGINIGTHILRCADALDRPISGLDDVRYLSDAAFPVLDEACGEKITEIITKARESCDSVGGETQTAVFGLPAGLGEPWFDSAESMLSHAVFGIGGVKGIDFGLGFGFGSAYGSEVNDAFRNENGKIITETNNNGGINGGITNGMPVIFRCAVKPTPSISRVQKTVDVVTGENAELEIKGRHDPAIIRRVCPVLDSITAIVIADMLSQRYGTDVLRKGIN
ncbi:MAG: chorismate synthase [Oscillospiraceae bacterium]|nr:chorismate synthase [Oscillospiraceae bacterium]